MLNLKYVIISNNNKNSFENKYLWLYKCLIHNSMFKNEKPTSIEHLSNILIIFKYLLNIEKIYLCCMSILLMFLWFYMLNI
jgi:hypothetical protein